MNYSQQRLTRMLQGTNARTLPTQLNSVRALQSYKGSMDAQDLLDLYVGNDHYRQLNKALRAPDVQTAKQQVWDEKGMMQPRLTYQGVPESYWAKNTPEELPMFSAIAKGTAESLMAHPAIDKNKPGTYFKNHPLSYTDGFNQLPLAVQAKKVIGYQIPETALLQPALEGRVEAENYFNQVLASAPHIENALLQRPAYIINDSTLPLNRGLHFANEEIYNNFINQHQPGAIVEYPAFTSTTYSPSILDGFSDQRMGEIPVQQNILPAPGSNQYSAYDVNNPAEKERLYPPGQRFKVISSSPLEDKGTQMMIEETNELTPVEQRTKNILGRMKSVASEFDRTQPRRQTEFIQQPDGRYDVLVDGRRVRQLSPESMQIGVRNVRNEPGWDLNIR